MSNDNGRERAAFGRLVTQCMTAAVVIVAAGWFSFLWERSESIRVRREVAHQASKAHCQQADDEACEGAAAIMSALADEDAVDVAVWQIWLNMAGLLGLGATVIYARRAWLAAQVSAEAATTALDHTKADSAEQSERFKQQLKIAKDSVEAAREATISNGRAWIRVEIKIISDLSFFDDTVAIDIRMTIENIGRSPAVGVLVNYKLSADVVAVNQQIRERIRWRRSRIFESGKIMFPDQPPTTQEYELRMSRAEFIAKRDEARAIREPGEPVDPDQGIFPVIVAGVEYNLPGDAAHRVTYVYGYLRRTNAGRPDFDGSDCCVDLSDLEMIPDVMTGPIT